ncbi:MAG: aminotransferase class I/II-fold pyridoxal phosphate-dependent enzyme [Bacteroidales bacterium]|jgi:dTDP-4-amino-4,6-dideoxygalactose transaminase|nr:aminotransferase class I/II-fold pyridoxal phosphate-dependent enzyme [Bacteroidales bacterium]
MADFIQDRIWLSTPHMSGHEMKYIEEAFQLNNVFPLGPNVTGLEKDLARFTGAAHCCCLSSGTAAIHLALIALGVEQGDEVICPTFTFSASANPIAYLKATPVFVESEASTWNIRPTAEEASLEEVIKARIKAGKRPKAIIVVHLYGMPARMDEIMRIAAEFEIPVVEDAAESLGSRYQGRSCGTWGDIGVLSFNGNKIITTSGGGAMLSNNKAYCDLAVFLSTQARDPAPYYQHSHIGYNYRMSNISAGIGRGQMEVLEQRVAKRRENFRFYQQALKNVPGIIFPDEPSDEFFSNRWLTTILVVPEQTGGVTNDDLRVGLDQLNIETRPLWKPMHLQPVFRNCPAYVDGTSEWLFNHGLCLPSSTSIKDQEREMVVDAIKKMIES